MLRCKFVGHGNAFVHVLAEDGEGLFERFFGGGFIGFGEAIDLEFDLGIDRGYDGGVVGNENGTGDNVVFGLGDEIGSDDFWIGRVVGNDEDFGGSGEHVNAAVSIDDGFGGGDPFVSWSDNDIAGWYRWDSVGGGGVGIDTVGHGGDGLSASDAEDNVGSGNVGGGEGDGGWAGGGEDDVGASGGAGGDDCHEDGGGEGVASSGGVASGGWIGLIIGRLDIRFGDLWIG